MRSQRGDDVAAVALAICAHLAVALLLWLSMRPWTVAQESAGGMAADVVDIGQLSGAMRRTLRNRPTPVEPLPEPVPEDEPEAVPPPAQDKPQVQLPQPDDVDQDEVVDAPTPNVATQTRVQEQKTRQAQADLTVPTDAQEQAQAQRMDAEREAQLAEIRKRRAAASREAMAAEQRLAQLNAPRGGSAAEDAARADATASGSGNDDGLKARYAAALQDAIRSKWTRPDNVQSGAFCKLVIRQLPGGEVVDAQVASPCVYDEQGRRSIEAAVLKAQPLPYAGFEPVFERTITLNFRAP